MTDVRSRSGYPSVSDFRSGAGTPLVVDEVTGNAYVLKNGDLIVKLNGPAPSITDNGAVGDGTTDNSGAMQEVIDDVAASGGGQVLIPEGVFRGDVTVPNFVELIGTGEGSILRPTGNTFAVSLQGNRCGARNLAFDTTATQSAGGAISFLDAGSNIRISDLYMGSGLYYGLYIAPDAGAVGIYYIDRVRWNGVTTSNTAIQIGDGTHLVTDVHLSNLSGTAASGAGMVSWMIIKNNSDTVYVNDSTFHTGGTAGGGGITVGEAAANSVTGAKFTRVLVDSIDNYGWNIQKCRGMEMTECDIQSCANGMVLAANVLGLQIFGGIIQNNVGWGVIVQTGAAHFGFHGVTVADNNTGNTAFPNGIDIAADVSNFKILDCTIGNFLLSGHQKTGVVIAPGTSDYYHVVNNRFIGNETAGFTDGAVGANIVTTGNLTS